MNLKIRFEKTSKKDKSSNIPVIGRDIPYASEKRKLGVLKLITSQLDMDNFEQNKPILRALIG